MCLLFLGCWACSNPTDIPPEAELRSYYDAANWLRLRDAVDDTSPPFYRGVVAATFQDLDAAEKYFGLVSDSDPDSQFAHDGRVHLLNAYHRAGRYDEALNVLDEALAHNPNATDLKSARDFYSSLALYPAQEGGAREPSQVAYSRRGGGIVVPVRINGMSADYLLDTGAGLSVMTESEAMRFGLKVSATSTKGQGSSGAEFSWTTAVAPELSIGTAQLRNVAFVVFPDDQIPFSEVPQQQRGGIGLPALLALGVVRWSSDGTFEVGGPSERDSRQPSMCFDGDKLLAEIEFRGEEISVVLDTGATTTHLWSKFHTNFGKALGEPQARESYGVTGVGGTRDIESLKYSELVLGIDGFEMTLKPARLLLGETTSMSQRFYGNLGIDLLNQAERVTLDFRTMRLTLQ